MSNASKNKGTAAETAVVDFLRAHGWVMCERRAQSGVSDRGDVAGLPGVVVEVKAAQRLELAAWCDERDLEVENDDAELGVLVVKRRGRGDPASWYWVLDGDTFARLLKEAGR